MSLVTHDSISKCRNGVEHDSNHDQAKKTKAGVPEEVVDKTENEVNVTRELNRNNHNYVTGDIDPNRNHVKINNATKSESLSKTPNIDKNETKFRDSFYLVEDKSVDSTKYVSTTGNKEPLKLTYSRNLKSLKFENNADKQDHPKENHMFKAYDIENTSRNPSRKTQHSVETKIWQKNKKHKFLMKNSNTSKKITEKANRNIKWKLNSGVLISFVMLNVAGLSSAVDSSSFSSALTSRMIASFLGYPSTCTVRAEVRPCTLTLTCWLRGGTRLRGCGGWLFSCCGLPEPNQEAFDNSIPSSEWKYKPPTKLLQVPQRSVLPNNVFRRRVDDDATQMECGLPSSRLLQKRIIGGREARFAEFPWQAHVRISEFQCGGVLVSRRFVATAAHCVSRAHTRDIAVWLGAIDTSATHHPARKLGVIQKILHPLFQFRMTQPDRYDVALLRLSRPVTYTAHILPICLPERGLELRGRSGVIAGWGKTDASSGHTGTNLLRSANVPILSREQCINWHQSKQISVEIHSEMICAGHSDGHQDACLGDSGGPLIVLDSGRYYLVGITSAGFGCGVDHQPGIYHNVKLTASWIRSVISPTAGAEHYFN